MGAKTWMLAYADGNAREILESKPPLDRAAASALAARLFPSVKLEAIENGTLSDTSPRNNEIYVGCFPGLSIVAAEEFALDHPSRLPGRFLSTATGGAVYLHAMHSVSDWFAYAVWEDGKLKRSLSVAPDNGVIEDIGAPMSFEAPYWAGEHAVFEPGEEGDYPLPFHPLELGEAALAALFGYQIEGADDTVTLDPETIPLLGFRRVKPWWKLW